MGIPELRFSLPISWAHSARSFSNSTSLQSRSSIFLRQSAMSIAPLPCEPLPSRKTNRWPGPALPLLLGKTRILTQPLPHVLDFAQSAAQSHSQPPPRLRKCQLPRTALESRHRSRPRSAVSYTPASVRPESAHRLPTLDACP